MTPEELEPLVERTPREIVQALAPLGEAERRKLSKAGVQLLADLKKTYQSLYSQAGTVVRAELIALAVGPWGTAKNISAAYSTSEFATAAFQILEARRPDWLPKWAEHHLDAAQMGSTWGVVRQLVISGALPRPTSDRYIRGMIQGRAGAFVHGVDSVRKALEIDRGLLEDEIWRIFEIAGSNQTVLESYEIHMMTNWSWGLTLKELAAEGVIDRGRLLDASLDALARGPQPKNATWYNEFHATLEPTLEERAARQQMYGDLLASPVPTVVGVALEGLAAVAKGKQLDGKAFVQSVPPVFELKAKNHPTAALKLLEQVVKQDPALARQVAWAAAGGIGHASADVQGQALALLEATVPAGDADLAARIAGRLDLASPTLRERVRALVGRACGCDTDAERTLEAGPTGSGASGEMASLVAEAAAIDPKWRSLAGIDALVEAWEKGGALPPAKFDAADVPQLDPERALVPIRSLEELIDRLLAAVEGLASADEFELLLDGLSRLATPKPDDFAMRTASLAKRITEVHAGFADDRLEFAFEPRSWLSSALKVWLHGAAPLGNGSRAILPCRVCEVSQRIAARESREILACPTHAGGWISPAVLVERVKKQLAERLAPAPFDLISALWRLAPDGRKQAWDAARELPGEVGAAIRFALGGDPPESSAVKDANLWLAAHRGRAPREPAEFLRAIRMPNVPDGVEPARYAWKIQNGPKPVYPQDPWPFSLAVQMTPALALSDRAAEHPVSGLHELVARGAMMDYLSPAESRMMASLWPANPDAALWISASSVVGRFDQSASSFSPAHIQLEPLLSSDSTWSEAGCVAVALALMARAPELHGMATDVLIAAVEDGRTTGEDLGAVLGQIARSERAMLNRLADVLSVVGRGTLLGAHACRRITEGILAALETPPRDLHYMLSALAEWLAMLGEGLAPAAGRVLAGIKTGKTAKLAKQVIAAAKGPSQRGAVFAQALRGRLDRAARWRAREV